MLPFEKIFFENFSRIHFSQTLQFWFGRLDQFRIWLLFDWSRFRKIFSFDEHLSELLKTVFILSNPRDRSFSEDTTETIPLEFQVEAAFLHVFFNQAFQLVNISTVFIDVYCAVTNHDILALTHW